ncbi:uncharacterized protein Hap1MRO34_026142 [Clarias gariepinus]
MMLIWRKSFTRASSSPPPSPPGLLLARSSTVRPACTTKPPAARAAPPLPSLPLYLGLFACLLLLVLALVFVTLYRMKHTVAPVPCYTPRAHTDSEADTEAESTGRDTEDTP